jgi:membrane protein
MGASAKIPPGVVEIFTDRLISFSLILSLGFVLTVSLILNALVAALSSRLNNIMVGAGTSLLPLIDNVISFLFTTIMFATIFKVLPDAKIKWKDVSDWRSDHFISCSFLVNLQLVITWVKATSLPFLEQQVPSSSSCCGFITVLLYCI